MHVNVMSNQIFILTVTLIILNHAKLIEGAKKIHIKKSPFRNFHFLKFPRTFLFIMQYRLKNHN